VETAAVQDGLGVCIRVVQDDLADLLRLDQALDSLLATVGVDRAIDAAKGHDCPRR
jgi:hypothetical protein